MAPASLMRAVLFVLVLSVTSSYAGWQDCSSQYSTRLVNFLSFSSYPAAVPGQYVHFASTFSINQDISSANVSWYISYKNSTQLLAVSGVQLCNFTSALSCNQLVVANSSIPIGFDWLVPNIPSGDYYVTYIIALPGNTIQPGCLQFDLNIGGSTDATTFTSYFSALLIGNANYTDSLIQVGPVGVLPYAQGLPWGVFSSVVGTADVVHSSFNPKYYIWGLTGNNIKSSYDTVYGNSTVYSGKFFVGYVGPYGSWNTPGNFLVEGNFVLERTVGLDGTVGIRNGYVNVLPVGGTYPAGWFNPINLARVGNANLTLNEHGQFMVASESFTCLNDPTSSCQPAAVVAPGTTSGISNHNLGLILGLILGVALIVAIALGVGCLVYRRRRPIMEEDRVYRGRPNEYGDALVVDDIIQKSKVHRGAALPMLNPRNVSDYPPTYFEQYPMPGDGRRGSRRPIAIGRPASSIRSPSSVKSSRPYSDDESDEPVRDTSRSRSRSRSPRRGYQREASRHSMSSRSTSPESRYSDSASGSSRSRSRSRTRSASPNSSRDGPRR